MASLSRGISGSSAASTSSIGWFAIVSMPGTDQVLVGRERVHDVEPVRKQPQPERQAVDRVPAVRAPGKSPVWASRPLALTRATMLRDADHQLVVRGCRGATLQLIDRAFDLGAGRAVEQVRVARIHGIQQAVEVGQPALGPLGGWRARRAR